MRYAYYPGCSLSSTGQEYDMSTKEIAEILDIELWEIPGWNCCGASSAHLTDHLLSLALPARNMAIAEKEGLDVLIPCAACYARSKAAELAVKESKEMRTAIEETIERPYEGRAKAKSILDVLANDIDIEKIKENIDTPLKGIKAACYYGCLLVRPKAVRFDDPEDPQSMDKVIQTLGGESVDWAFKTECCGASHATTKGIVGLPMIERILIAAKEAGANCVVTACPMCMNNLDMRQEQIEKEKNYLLDLPVFYITELMGLAFGVEPKELGIDRHFKDALTLVNDILEEGGRTL
ncbi:CoB--CoM heterodisulfide reductase iron-sulfur subunit B family protein [Dehalobacter sp. DCM]|uniref:CoB--CoM heterodisulfide reductase iron-sulfur subunit B family protein n=1 Tax=Dehalobacter sp. DCM TaxID=2907827 RepID=UPI0030821FEE|nr:CoB--CoM heterodisulfide reductase iron-sulfur subunit B family protein [Dehalobacter sp. DCM]